MAYGKTNNKDRVFRAISIGVGDITRQKKDALSLLRDNYIAVANQMVAAVFEPDPFSDNRTKKQIAEAARQIQKDFTGFNQAYAEKARLSVTEAIIEIRKRYFRKLYGRLLNCDSKIVGGKGERIYHYVPEDMQDKVTEADFAQLKQPKQGCAKTSCAKAMNLVEQVAINNNHNGLTRCQVEIITEIYRQVQHRYKKPVYGRDEGFTCQIHLDYRNIAKTSRNIKDHLTKQARLLVDSDNSRYRCFLEISNPVPRQQPVRIPLTLSKRAFQRLMGKDDKVFVNSLIVEIGESRVEIKAVIGKKKPKTPPIEDATHLIGRDFGYKNTVALSVDRVNAPILGDHIVKLSKMDKEQAREYLKSHFHANDNIVERSLYSGKQFLKLIHKHATIIERLSGNIDRTYNQIFALKSRLAGHFGLPEGKHLPKDLKSDNPDIVRMLAEFTGLLNVVQGLKKMRRRLYKKIAGIKKSWFGYLANIEIELAV